MSEEKTTRSPETATETEPLTAAKLSSSLMDFLNLCKIEMKPHQQDFYDAMRYAVGDDPRRSRIDTWPQRLGQSTSRAELVWGYGLDESSMPRDLNIDRWQAQGLIPHDPERGYLVWKHVTRELRGNLGFPYIIGERFLCAAGMATAGPAGALKDWRKRDPDPYVIAIWCDDLRDRYPNRGVYYALSGVPVALYRAECVECKNSRKLAWSDPYSLGPKVEQMVCPCCWDPKTAEYDFFLVAGEDAMAYIMPPEEPTWAPVIPPRKSSPPAP